MTSRRGFFATAASGLAWMLGTTPKITTDAIQRMRDRKYALPTEDASPEGGFLVPAHLEVEVVSLVYLGSGSFHTQTHVKSLTIEEVCQARGVPYVPETEEEKSKRLRFVAAMQKRFQRSKPCES